MNRTMTVLTSEAHVLAVARRWDLPVYVLDGVMRTTRPLAGDQGSCCDYLAEKSQCPVHFQKEMHTLVYRAYVTKALVA